MEVCITEGVYHQDPLVEKLRDCLRVPPILIEHSILELSDLSHRQQNVLHNQVIQANVDIEGHRNEPKEELSEAHPVVGLRLDERIDDLCHEDVVHKQANEGH